MQRRLLIAVIVGGGLVLGTGLIVWAGTQGLFGPHGKSRHLLSVAQRQMQQGQLDSARVSLEQLITTFPDSPHADEALLALGRVYEEQNQLVQARNVYRLFLEKFQGSSLTGQAQSKLGALNVSLLFSPTITDSDEVYEVKPGDTLRGIAAAHHTTIELIKRMNGLTSDVIRTQQELKVPKAHFSIVVDKSENQLLLTADNQFFKSYTVATGQNNSTPVGTFKIVNKVVNPIWYHQGAAVPPDSPDNILGTRWMGLDKPSYGIHGSVDPTAMGQQVTAGCVRMTNPEVEELFAISPVGTEVTIVD